MYQQNVFTSILFCSCLAIIIILIFINVSSNDLNAELLSPSFPRQEISDDKKDWKSFSPDNNANCTGIDFGSNSTNIPELTGVSYHSDGRTFNPTLCLSEPPFSDPFKEKPPSGHIPIYSMGIGSITGDNSNVKINYVTSVLWYPLGIYDNTGWIKTVEELNNYFP